jgi:hypothetical protein
MLIRHVIATAHAAHATPNPPAVDAATHAALSTANATWALFWATVALAVIACAAGIAAYLAYREQYRANRVEMDPVLYVTFASPLPDDHYIEDIIRLLGTFDSEINTMRYTRGASAERPPLTRTILEIQNIGRSPAIDVRLPVSIRVTSRVTQRDSQGHALNIREANLKDEIRLSAIPVNGKGYVEFQSDVDGSFEIDCAHEARAIDYRRSPRATIKIPSLGVPLLVLPSTPC